MMNAFKLVCVGACAFLSIAASAGKYDAFQALCAQYKGEFRGDASGYLIPGEQQRMGVARCAIHTHTEEYWASNLTSSSDIPVFDPAMLEEFKSQCPAGRVFVTSKSDSNYTCGARSAQVTGKSSLVIICY